MEREFTWLRAIKPVGFGWMAEDLSTSGAMGDASIATSDKGDAAAGLRRHRLHRIAARRGGFRSFPCSAASRSFDQRLLETQRRRAVLVVIS